MQDYSFLRYIEKKESKHPKISWKAAFLLIIFFAVVFSLAVSKSLKFTPPQIKSADVKEGVSKTNNDQVAAQQEFTQTLEKETAKLGGTYSLYLYDLKTKKEYGINEQTVLTAASVNKIPILAALYFLAGKGEIDLEKTITLQKSNIQDYGTGTIRYDPPGTVYSIKTLARLMMEKSDNTAAYILGTLVLGLDKIQTIIDSWGLTQTNMGDNKTSAKDMAQLLIKMYQGEITTKALTAEMLGFMDKSDFDDRIPAGLPLGVKIYHKTGDEVGKIHDVGIIEAPNRPYYLGIFTIDMTDEETTKKTQAQISKIVFEYMEKL